MIGQRNYIQMKTTYLKQSLVVIAILFLLTASSFSAPRLTIQDGTFNFGYVPQNSKISHSFWLKSTGDDTLKILKITPG